MTKRELIQEYAAGRIGRRDFIARLTGLGVSGAAALAYAQGLVPSAAAAPLGRDQHGYVVHAVNGEYGTGGAIKTIQELLRFFSNFLQHVVDVLTALLQKLLAEAPAGARLLAPIAVGDPLPNGGTVTQNDVDQLKTMRNQLTEQRDAIRAAFADFGGTPPAASAGTPPTEEDDLTTLADQLNTLVSLQAAVIPTVSGDGPKTTALRTTLTTAALVEARHAAFLNQLVGDDPFPESFTTPLSEADIQTLIADLG